MTKKPTKKAAKKAAPKKSSKTKAKTVKTPVTKKKSSTIRKKSDEAEKLADWVIKGMQEKKAKNITLLDLREIGNRVSDFFVIADADSTTHVNSIAASIEEMVKKNTSERPFHSEGWENSQWILMDYVNVVAHVFLRETREFYNLESLWADAEVQHIN
jgi:ribosome-associated protein